MAYIDLTDIQTQLKRTTKVRAMMKSTTIRMDDGLKREASAKLEALGLNFNTFVVMATRQFVTQNRIPFELNVPADYLQLIGQEEETE